MRFYTNTPIAFFSYGRYTDRKRITVYCFYHAAVASPTSSEKTPRECTTQVHEIEDNINSDFHDGASLDMFTSDEDVEIPSHSTYIEARGDRGC
ncbi:hypothetical protein MRB53_029376 [Persea americana]|uniref:Uncharacterized protein n=1 Tax=Persea americana TaxID=3435 RepID=A0ACC2KI65_PERAE|nr:hypothetical protein MRB53_029376 [Persea americana]